MSEFDDHDPSEDLPAFDDPAHDGIRSLLADAAMPAVPPVIPAEVAARLDATLAELVAEEAGAAQTVTRLPRRRLAPRLLVAAAAVVLLGAGGVGLAQVLNGTQQNDSLSSATADSVGSAEGAAPDAAAPEMALGGQAASEGGVLASEGYSLDRRLSTTEFTRDGFAQQVTDLIGTPTARVPFSSPQADSAAPPEQKTPPAEPGAAAEPGATAEPGAAAGKGAWTDTADGELADLSAASQAGPGCPGPTVPAGALAVRISFEQHPAILVLHPVLDGARYVAAWSCDGRDLLAFATISA